MMRGLVQSGRDRSRRDCCNHATGEAIPTDLPVAMDGRCLCGIMDLPHGETGLAAFERTTAVGEIYCAGDLLSARSRCVTGLT